MNKRTAGRIVAGLALTLGGCGLDTEQRSDAAPIESVETYVPGLHVSAHDASTFQGSFAGDDGRLEFFAHAPDEQHAELDFTINGKLLHYEALAATDAHDGWFRVMADVAIERADTTLARQALETLIEHLGEDVSAMALFESSVPKMASFLAEQTPGSFVSSLSRKEYSVERPVSKSLNDDGLVCIKRNATVRAAYDRGKSGSSSSVSVVVGSNWGTSACGSGNYACMGRCGAGCNGFGGSWTLDCLEHDACSHDLCASGGASDANCGDEYGDAKSDIFTSCSGN